MAQSSYVTSLMMLDENKILSDLNNVAIDLGLINNVFQTSRIYIYYSVFARVLGNLTQIIAEYINNIDIDETTDEALLERLIKPFVRKKNAKVAKVILEFSRREDYEEATEIFIPREMEVMTEGNDPIIFRTAESRVLWKDSKRVLIPAYSVEFGSLNNLLPNTLTYFEDDESFLSQEIQVTNPYPAYGGEDEETAFDTRTRIDSFRWARDANKEYLQELLFQNGISYYGFNLIEYWDGAGSVLIAIDVPSEEQYYDVVSSIEAAKREAVKYYYCRVNHVYADMEVTVKITGDNLYTEYQINEVEQHVFTATKLYFDNEMYVGRKLSKNRLEAFILQYLVDARYDVYEVDLKVIPRPGTEVDEDSGQIIINEFEKIVANKIFTDIDYEEE